MVVIPCYSAFLFTVLYSRYTSRLPDNRQPAKLQDRPRRSIFCPVFIIFPESKYTLKWDRPIRSQIASLRHPTWSPSGVDLSSLAILALLAGASSPVASPWPTCYPRQLKQRPLCPRRRSLRSLSSPKWFCRALAQLKVSALAPVRDL